MVAPKTLTAKPFDFDNFQRVGQLQGKLRRMLGTARRRRRLLVSFLFFLLFSLFVLGHTQCASRIICFFFLPSFDLQLLFRRSLFFFFFFWALYITILSPLFLFLFCWASDLLLTSSWHNVNTVPQPQSCFSLSFSSVSCLSMKRMMFRCRSILPRTDSLVCFMLAWLSLMRSAGLAIAVVRADRKMVS